MEIKYIYFEVKYITGEGPDVGKVIQNENALLFKPKTNRSGVWSYTNCTEKKHHTSTSYEWVEQYWIDLEVYREWRGFEIFRRQVEVVMERLNEKLKEQI